MLDAMKEEYRKSLLVKMDTIRQLLKDYREGHPKAEQNIRHLAHSLHGSGATYGFPAVSEAGKAVELAPSAELIRRLTELMKVLRDTVESTPASSESDVVSEAKGDEQIILVVDDDGGIAKLLGKEFQRLGRNYRCLHAATALAARNLHDEHKIDLVLLDLILPDEDGRNLLREFKYEFSRKVPVFVLSAIDRDMVRVECMSLGADKYFTKPLDVAALVPEVDRLLGKNKDNKLALKPKHDDPLGIVEDKRVKIDLSGKSVLLAEDDEMQARAVKQRLLQEGLSVVHVSNGREALEALQKTDYSLIILDVRMPEADGFEVLQLLRDKLRLKDVPVIMLTAMGSEHDIVRGYDLGANDYMLKPFSPVQLIARIKSLLK